MDKKVYSKWYREQHREELNTKAKAYYVSHREEQKRKARERSRRRRLEVPEEVRERDRLVMRGWRFKQKVLVLSHYGRNGEAVCVKCGEDRLPCLSIDHVDGGGRLDRRQRGCGSNLYSHLIRESYPIGFQTLCMNCQWVKRFENNEQR